jgi:hypothetical protein
VDFVVKVDVVFEVIFELVCQAGFYESHGRGIDARFALWTLLGTVRAKVIFSVVSYLAAREAHCDNAQISAILEEFRLESWCVHARRM